MEANLAARAVRRPPSSHPSVPPSSAPSRSPDATPVADAGGTATRARRVAAAARWIAPLGGLAVLGAALSVLRRELGGAHYRQLSHAVRAIPATRVAAAAALTVLAYGVLCGYDALALAYVRLRLPLRRLVATSALAYAISQTLGFAALTGNAIRYRFWSAWGLSTAEIGQAAAFVGATFTAGLATVCGLALTFEPSRELALVGAPPLLGHALGVLLLAAVGAYVGWSVHRAGRPLTARGWTFPVPGPRLAVAQLALAVIDWGVAASVLWVLLPPTPGLGFLPFVGAFTIAQCAGLLSHVPGGIGVFETLLVLFLRPYVPAPETVAIALAYRAIYYVAPFALAAATLGVAEAMRPEPRAALRAAVVVAPRRVIGAAAPIVARGTAVLLPTALGAMTFLAGAVLVFSGATPSLHHRVRALATAVPLPVIEVSHFVASVAGVGLLILAWAIRRRLDAAYGLTVGVLALGIVASLLKGLDWEEATALAAVLVVVVPARRAFYRRTALTAEPLTPAWIAAALAVVGASLWLGMFSYEHVRYAHELWWQFTLRGDAPRFLRASAGAVATLGALGLVRLLRPAEPEPALPSEAELARAAAVARAVPATSAHLARRGAQSLLFSAQGDAFLMYGVAGRSWIAMGDPVGSPARRAELAWRFKEEADRHGAWPVFYEVGADALPTYIDLGLSFMKLGEEAIVPLAGFSLDGGGRRWMRRALRDAERAGLTFRVAEADEVPALLPVLRRVSDEWLAAKSTREKGFSLGRFDEAYLRRQQPMALVMQGGRPVAFANLWLAAPGTECAPDLMRHADDAPAGVMDFLFVSLLVWAKARGYTRFNLGMAPLAGLEARELAPLWARAGALVARRGEHFYNFRGLRAYKAKFDPVWEPRYLASPGGLGLPRVLANVAALVSGGLAGTVRR